MTEEHPQGTTIIWLKRIRTGCTTIALLLVLLPGIVRLIVKPSAYNFGWLTGGVIFYGGLTYVLLTLVILVVKAVLVRFSPVPSAAPEEDGLETESTTTGSE